MRLLSGLPLRVFGDGLQLRDFNYVEDAVDALMLCAQDPAADGQVFNLGAPGDRINLRDLAAMMVAVHGGGDWEIVPFPPERKAIDIGSYYSNSQRISKTLGWAPSVPLREGVERTLRYFDETRAHYWTPSAS